MTTVFELEKTLSNAFPLDQASLLSKVIFESYNDLVKTSNFNELKEIVRDLAEAQKRTECKMVELAGAQERTETKVAELARAQERTEIKVSELAGDMKGLAKEMKVLARGLSETQEHLGGLSNSVSYSFENEAYRMLPGLLQREYGIAVKDRLIRTEMSGEEINLFCRASRNGKPIIVVGKTKLRCHDRTAKKVFEMVERKVNAVKMEHPDDEILRLLITHYATPKFIEKARANDINVIQSFEW